jgi:tetratricopeptide (TPR) repeat protein
VIARNTAFTFKGKSIDAKEIGKELGVRYVLEGSVQRDQSRVRVNAQLIDAETGAHLWADRFEEDVTDLFKPQDQVVARLANSLGYELIKAEAEKSVHSRDPDAIDLDIRGRALLLQGMQQSTKDKNNVARAWFEQALAIYPDDADALAGNSFTYLVEYIFRWSANPTDYDAKVLWQADRAIALAPDNARAYWVKSAYLYLTNRASESLHAANAGLALNPNFAPLFGARSGAEIGLGRFEEANADVRQAMRLSPRDPDVGWWRVQLGEGELGLGHLDASIDEYQKAIDFGYRLYPSYIGLSAAYALKDKMDDAKSALAEARRLNPTLSIKWLRTRWSWAFANLPSLFEGLRKAGMSEE